MGRESTSQCGRHFGAWWRLWCRWWLYAWQWWSATTTLASGPPTRTRSTPSSVFSSAALLSTSSPPGGRCPRSSTTSIPGRLTRFVFRPDSLLTKICHLYTRDYKSRIRCERSGKPNCYLSTRVTVSVNFQFST